MFAVTAARFDPDDPLNGLEMGERPEPVPEPGWTTVSVAAASLNHHELWTLRGVGVPASRLPIVLGCDAAGTDEEGNEVVVHAVIGNAAAGGGDETLDPGRSLLSERYDGTFAQRVAVPRRNLLPKPASLSFAEAACLPTAYLTAYRMLFGRAGLEPGATVLVQGAGGGVATALILLGRAAGFRVWATSRTEAKRDACYDPRRAAGIPAGCAAARAGRRGNGDCWRGNLGALTQVTAAGRPDRDFRCDQRRGAARGPEPGVLPSALGDRVDHGHPRSAWPAVEFCAQTGVRPLIDNQLPLARARDGFTAMLAGEHFGKIVFTL